MPPLAQRLAAEALGTAFLLAAVVGSGVMAQRLAGGNLALALLGNTLPTGAILTVLILIFGPVSGAHFNPAVTLAFALRTEISWRAAAAYVAVQLLGGLVGVWVAHLMFDLPVWQVATTARIGVSQCLAEFVATFGLLLTVFGCAARAPQACAYAVGALHHGGLLVHRVDIVRQSRCHRCTIVVRHLCRHRAPGRAAVRHRTIDRRAHCDVRGGVPLAPCQVRSEIRSCLSVIVASSGSPATPRSRSRQPRPRRSLPLPSC